MTKRISVFGDSISTFEGVTVAGNRCYYDASDTNGTGVVRPSGTWWMQVIESLGGELCANGSFSGSMVAGSAFPAGRSLERARQILGPQGEVPDLVLVFIGINDYGWGGSEAQAKGGSEAAPNGFQEAEEGFSPRLAPAGVLQEFTQAYREMLENIRAQAPHAQIWCLTLIPGRLKGQLRSSFCYRLRGIDIARYNEAIRCMAQMTGCQVADIAAFGFDYEAADGTHPTVRGMEQIAALATAAITRTPLEEALFARSLASQDPCSESSCIGCPHARSTGTKWSCVCERSLTPSPSS